MWIGLLLVVLVAFFVVPEMAVAVLELVGSGVDRLRAIVRGERKGLAVRRSDHTD